MYHHKEYFYMSAVKKNEISIPLIQKSVDFLIVELRQHAVIKTYYLWTMVILILNI
jgi:hypothetical protein